MMNLEAARATHTITMFMAC
uniref:Alpha-glucosidase 2 n=1 Tax=Rhizophora mucronata TaxID=61149 RepID=A0A2P2KY39_RHIMU